VGCRRLSRPLAVWFRFRHVLQLQVADIGGRRREYFHRRYRWDGKKSKNKVKEKNMSARLEYAKIAPGAFRAMLGLEKYLKGCDLEPSLLHLVKMRVSQINGCAFCLDMHSKDARAADETEQRLYLLNAWREAPFYSDRERAALAWTEALTLIGDSHVPDEIYTLARQHFSEQELVDLSVAIVAINGWNRLAIGFRSEVGGYRSGMAAEIVKRA
jgi:AhpD family alkylhydroperoxidase